MRSVEHDIRRIDELLETMRCADRSAAEAWYEAEPAVASQDLYDWEEVTIDVATETWSPTVGSGVEYWSEG